MEQTLLMIKPDAVERGIIGKILSMVDDRGLECVGLRLTRMCGNMAEQFYAVHKGKEFFSRLVEYMTSGPVVVVALQGENAVARARRLIGATNPEEAAEGTIRRLFAESMTRNAVHGSDSVENGQIEVDFFFSQQDLLIPKG